MDITVKGRNLTQALAAEITSGSGYSLTYGQQSGSSVTIPAADAMAVGGATLTLTYTGNDSDEDAAGVLRIGSTEVSSDCDLITNKSSWTEVDLTDTSRQVDCWIGANGGFSSTSAQAKQTCYLLPATGLTKVRITANSSNGAIFLFMKSTPTFPSGAAYAQYLCRPDTARRTQTKATTATYDLTELTDPCVAVLIGLESEGYANPMAYAPAKVEVM